jgi:cellulose biosynthesis protein BcsQ
LSFDPERCRNESEVESKLIVQYLLPQLGYTADTWHQEVAVGNIRLDFLAFAVQVMPFVLDANSPLSVVIEAKHPQQNLDRHTHRLKRYLTSLNVQFGLLTNGQEIRIYKRNRHDIQLIFRCSGREVSSRIDEIKALIGREQLQKRDQQAIVEAIASPPALQPLQPQLSEHLSEPIFMWNRSEDQDFPTPHLLSKFDEKPSLFSPPITKEEPIDISLQRLDLTLLERSPAPNLNPLSPEIQQNSMKVIAVYHNKGGVGKTTTVVNLAAALSKQGKRVLVIDLDSQANTTFAVGLVKFDDEELDDIKDSNISHVLRSEEFYSIEQVARRSQFCNPEISVVPSHITLMQYENELNQYESSRVRLLEKLKAVEHQYDLVLIDTPPSLNLYARIAIITADYLLIPSDLKPFANQGLLNVRDFIKKNNEFRKFVGKPAIEILGVLPCKISTNAKFVQSTLPKRMAVIPKRYGFEVMDAVIYEREDLAKCTEQTKLVDGVEIPDPRSVLDFKPDSVSAQEFEVLATEILQKIA